MTTERPTYNADAYVADRPSYPPRVYEILAAYHRAGHPGASAAFQHAVDLGCGPGFMALELAKVFDCVTGVDPEAGMVAAGLQPRDGVKRIAYHVGTAEDLRAVGIEDGSVDLVVAGEAAHYFNYSTTYPELARGYGRLTFARDDVNDIVGTFMSETLRPYWTEPGWSISEGLYDRIPFPTAVARGSGDADGLVAALPDLEGDGHPITAHIDEPAPPAGDSCAWDGTTAVRLKSGTTADTWYLRKTWTAPQLEKCFRTWSSVKRYQDEHPEDRVAELDVVGRVMAQITPLLGAEFEVVWPFVMMMIRRDATA